MRFIETLLFTKQISALLSDDEYAEFQNELSINPKIGTLIPSSNGLRKVRWSHAKKGKHSGIRTIYYFKSKADEIYMLVAYPKNQKTDLSPKEIKVLAQIVKEIK